MLVLSVITACQESAGPTGPTAPSGDIVIASNLPLSGLGLSAMPIEQGIRLAMAQHPTIGRFKLAYWSLDDTLAGNSSPDKAVQNVARMVDDHRVVAMIGPYVSFAGYPTIPVANRADLVIVSPTNSGICLTQADPSCAADPSTLRPSGHNNYFRIEPPDEAQGTAMARYAARDLNIRRVAVINEWGSDADTMINRFAKELELDGGRIVLKEDVDSGTADFKSFMASAQSNGAQAIYAIGDSPNDEVCIAASQMPAGILFLGTDAIFNNSDPECIGQALSRSESILATNPDVDITNSKDPAAMKAISQFHQAYPTSRDLSYAFAAYDSALLVIAAIEQAINANGGRLPDRRQVLDAVARSEYTGVTGTYSFDKNGDAIFPLMSVDRVVGGKWTYVSKIDASASSS